MHKVYLSIGGNIGKREHYLSQTRILIESRVGRIVKCSDVYESEPWGFDHHIPFLNQVLEVETELSALCLLDICQGIEVYLGRQKYNQGFIPRTTDIDILFYDDCIYTLPPIIVPHKLLHQRMFVLIPLAEIAPNLTHPLIGLSIAELKKNCEDTCKVWKYEAEKVF